MSFLKRLFRAPNGQDFDELKDERSKSQQRVIEAARRLARSAETVSRHKKERELAEQVERYRKFGAAD